MLQHRLTPNPSKLFVLLPVERGATIKDRGRVTHNPDNFSKEFINLMKKKALCWESAACSRMIILPI